LISARIVYNTEYKVGNPPANEHFAQMKKTTKKKAGASSARRKTDSSRDANLPEVIAEHLRELITRGAFPPGLQLRQMELAGRFNSSRVPLREALKLLSAEGIVDHDPNRGFFVAPLSLDEARQLYRIRHLLERELLGTVAWPSAEQLAQLREQLAKLEAALKEQDTAAWLEHHREFYRTIFELSAEKVLVAEVLRLIRLTDRYRALAAHALPSAQRKATQERHLLTVLAKRDRKRLMTVFEADRTQIEQGIQAVLEARGL
jgi:DNA-binding GntR family transcriptional regulator